MRGCHKQRTARREPELRERKDNRRSRTVTSLAALAILGRATPSDEPEGVRWSAKRQREDVERFRNYLNTMGAQGWEMVSYELVPMSGNFTGNVKGYAYLTFFKRQTS